MTAKRRPPAIESIIPDARGRTDTGYALGVHLHGLHGAWHRLWGMLVMKHTLGASESDVQTVRDQVSQALGRPMTDPELSELESAAVAYTDVLLLRGSQKHP